MTDSAIISPCGQYRYLLERDIEPDTTHPPEAWRRTLGVVMLNPSTADANIDDATIRRLKGYARRWGYGTLLVGNLFAYRATDPLTMKLAEDPIGPDCDAWLTSVVLAVLRTQGMLLVAWGAHARGSRRVKQVLQYPIHSVKLWCLGTTADGIPLHPLRLRADLVPVPWSPA